MKEMKKAIEEILKPYLKSEWKNAFEVYPEHDQKFLTDSQRIIRARRYDCMIVNGRPVLTDKELMEIDSKIEKPLDNP